MKVAWFHTAFGEVGGAEVLAAAQARGLRARGCELEVVSFGFQDQPWNELFGGAPSHAVPRRHWRDLLALDRSTKWAPRFRRALPLLKEYEVVVAHCQPLAALLGEGLPGQRKLWYCHEPPWRIHPDQVDYTLLQRLPDLDWLAPLKEAAAGIRSRSVQEGARRRLELRGTPRLDGMAANSEFARDTLLAIYGRADITVIPPMIEMPGAVANRSGISREGIALLVQARLGLLKNVEAVMRGFALYAKKAGHRAHLHIVGEGEDRTRLTALVEPLGLQGKVTFHGRLDPIRDRANLDAIYAACDVFALLPLDESFGMVFPEAAVRGLLLIGPDHGGPVEILEGGRLGDCLPPFEPEALADGLRRLERMDTEAVNGRRGKAYDACLNRYSPTAILPRLQAWIEGSIQTI